ncbi:MAG: hypothetical protein H7246_21500 [Phycisphaerae bacterium]|nr:hypothetical protein [Saprospiraceae bacterium]
MQKPMPEIKILASVELGNPAAHCAHFGICSIAVLSPKHWAIFKPRHVRHVKAMLSVTTAGCLRFEFPLEGMRSDTRAQFFPPEGFRVDSASVLPRVLATALRLPRGMETVPGRYAFRLFPDGLVLELLLSMTKPVLAA